MGLADTQPDRHAPSWRQQAMEWLGLRISNELPEGQVRLLDCTHNG